MNWNQALFPSLKGGVDARSRKCREATLVRADGVARSASPIGRSLKKSSAKSLGLKSFAELTTPSAALRRLRAFLLMPQPPLLFKEGNVSALKQSVNSFTRSQPWVSMCERDRLSSRDCDFQSRRPVLVLVRVIEVRAAGGASVRTRNC